MHDTSKTYQELIEENALLRQQIRGLQASGPSRRQTDAVLTDSEARLKEAQRITKIGSWEHDLLTNKIAWSDEMYRLYEIDQERFDLSYGIIRDIIHPEDRDAFDAVFTRALTHPESTRLIHRLLMPDGRVKYIDSRSEPHFNQERKAIRLVGTAQDITERRQVEVENQKLASIVMHSSELVNLADLDGKMIYLNDAGMKMLGISADEVTSVHITQVIPDHLLEKVQKEVLPAMIAGGWEGDLEYKNLKSGALTSVHAVIFLITDSKTGAPLYYANLSLDITERKQTEDALREREERLQTIFENAEEIIHMIAWDGTFLYISPSWELFTGFSVSETVGKSFANYVHPEDVPACLEVVKNVRETGQPHKIMEFRVKHASGKWIWFMNSGVAVKDGKGNPLYFMGVAMDITERKRAEEELIRVNRALRILSDTNHALIHIMDEATLLNEVCRIIVDVGGYRMALVGFAEHDEAKTILPVAHAGFESGYIESINVTWADNERGRGPGGTAIRTGKPSIAHNIPQDPAFAPWREAAIERGYKSNTALPLISEGQTFGELSIYSADTDAFDINEVDILKELADDLAFGITSLRKHVKGEQAEVALRESEERYRLIAENTADTIAVFDLNLNPTYISHSILNLRGYTVQEAMTQTWDQMLTPDSLEQATKMFADQMALESSGNADPARTAYIELEEYCKDGSTIWVELAASFLRDNNFKPIGILTVTRNITARKQAELELQKTLERLRKSFGATVQVMASAVEMRDPYTSGHQLRVANLACDIAKEMGLPQDKIEGIRMAGTIHDIGKLSIPSEILAKPTKLTNIEFSMIKEHSQIGYEMLKDVESPWPLAQIVYQHHERMDGSGYPRNLKGDEILMEARIMAVADVVEAMASHRPYRPGLGMDAALAEIEKNKGAHYDNAVADACLRLFLEKGYQLR